jgi:glyoxylase-like metal-dependent hydrolase (beta-lactamase superfamily II)/rhodanese-related sulfurtransferase
MRIEQIYTNCLAEAAYYIESNGEAAIIDPLRETEPYLQRLQDGEAELKYIFETHFHADFVSGHIDLARKTGAEIVFGPTANANYDITVAEDNEIFKLGNISIKVLHTPGHTMESSCFLLLDEEGNEHALFSGDTLFLGDVGRPDLAVKTDLTQEELAGYLFDSLQDKILPLPDSVIVYPGHGAGSACGKNLSSETVDSLGNQKHTNYALQPMTRKEFVKHVTDGLLPPPQYFPKNAMMNKAGYESIDTVLERGTHALDVAHFKAEIAKGAIVLDTRKEKYFESAHIPGSLFIGVDGNFAMWVGALITDLKQRIVFLAEAGREAEVVTRLARVGYDHAVGYLKGGMDAWIAAGEPVDAVMVETAEEFAKDYKNEDIEIIDVRKVGEYTSQHIEGAHHMPLDYIYQHLDDLDKDKEYYVHCAGGYRSLIAISILQPYGYKNLINVEGGFKAIEKAGVKMTDYVCPTSML